MPDTVPIYLSDPRVQDALNRIEEAASDSGVLVDTDLIRRAIKTSLETAQTKVEVDAVAPQKIANLEREIRRLEKKLARAAEYIIDNERGRY